MNCSTTDDGSLDDTVIEEIFLEVVKTTFRNQVVKHIFCISVIFCINVKNIKPYVFIYRKLSGQIVDNSFFGVTASYIYSNTKHNLRVCETLSKTSQRISRKEFEYGKENNCVKAFCR